MTEHARALDAYRARWRDDEPLRSSVGGVSRLAAIGPATGMTLSPSTFDRFRDSLGSARVAILDTNYIMNQVSQRARRGFAMLNDGPPNGRERSFAPTHVLTELYSPDPYGHRHKWDKLAEQSQDNGRPITAAEFQEIFERRYMPHITFVDVTGLFEDHPLVEAVRQQEKGRGAADAPTAQLAVLLSRNRPIVYSHDKHLWKPGVAPRHLEAVVVAGHHVDAGHATVEGVTYIGAGAVWAVNSTTRSAAAFLRVPDWATRLAAAGLLVWLLIDHQRRQAIVKALTPMWRVLETGVVRATDGLGVLTAAVAPVDPGDQVECLIAEVLVHRRNDDVPTAPEIQQELILRTPQPALAPSIRELRSALSIYPSFVEGPRDRYRLGVPGGRRRQGEEREADASPFV